MNISEELLHSMDAVVQHYGSGEYIFRQDSLPQFYYQIAEGEVKLNSYAEDGKEFIHSILSENSGICEAMMILKKPYPVNAVTITPCRIIKMTAQKFFDLLELHPLILKNIYTSLADSVFEKQTMMHTVTSGNAAARLKEILNLMKETKDNTEKFSMEITYTRQQLASMSGLTLETTIRILKKMEQENMLKTEGRKMYY
jgi:CRP-like cAMP-binding protein